MSELIILQLTQSELKQLIVQAVSEAFAKARESDRFNHEEYLTRAYVARRFQVTLTTINEWSRSGKLKRHYMGSRVYYLRSEVEGRLNKGISGQLKDLSVCNISSVKRSQSII